MCLVYGCSPFGHVKINPDLIVINLSCSEYVSNATCGEVSVSKVVDDLLALRPLPGTGAAEDEHNIGLLRGHLDHGLAAHGNDDAPPSRVSTIE